MTLEARSVPRFTPTFRLQWEQAQDCFVILYPEGMVKLSGSAGEILKRCDGERTVSGIIGELRRSFPTVESLGSDVTLFLEEAHGKGWIQFV